MNPLLPVVAFAIAGIVRIGSTIELPPTEADLGPIQARAEMIVSTAELHEALGRGVIVVEVGRDRRVFRAGHVKGARFLDWSSIAVETPSGVDRPSRERLEKAIGELGIGNTARIVVYARNVLEATWTWFLFDSLGHGDRVAILDGGWAKWLKEGRPVASGEFVPRRVEFRASGSGDAMIGLDELKRLLGTSLVDRPFVIDARAREEYRGETSGLAVRRPGHIPGAFSISWTRNLEIIDGVAVFRLPMALRSLYIPGQPFGNGEAIVYCRTGLEASMSYFVLRSIGLRPRLYSGSYVEWSTATDVPVARAAKGLDAR